MPQISLYIDEKTLQRVKDAATRRNTSISRWVAELIRTRVEPVYPEGYEELFGSIQDEGFTEPTDLSFSGKSRAYFRCI